MTVVVAAAAVVEACAFIAAGLVVFCAISMALLCVVAPSDPRLDPELAEDLEVAELDALWDMEAYQR